MTDTPETKRGRPSSYTDEIADEICVQLMMGKSLIEVCEADGMPAESTVYLWLLKRPEFSEKYARAREIQSERGVDEIIPIADDGRNDWMEKRNAEGEVVGWVENGEAIRRSQLRIDARKWKAGKLRPKVYGDKTVLSNDADNPVSFVLRLPSKAENTEAWLKQE